MELCMTCDVIGKCVTQEVKSSDTVCETGDISMQDCQTIQIYQGNEIWSQDLSISQNRKCTQKFFGQNVEFPWNGGDSILFLICIPSCSNLNFTFTYSVCFCNQSLITGTAFRFIQISGAYFSILCFIKLLLFIRAIRKGSWNEFGEQETFEDCDSRFKFFLLKCVFVYVVIAWKYNYMHFT